MFSWILNTKYLGVIKTRLDYVLFKWPLYFKWSLISERVVNLCRMKDVTDGPESWKLLVWRGGGQYLLFTSCERLKQHRALWASPLKPFNWFKAFLLLCVREKYTYGIIQTNRRKYRKPNVWHLFNVAFRTYLWSPLLYRVSCKMEKVLVVGYSRRTWVKK